MNCSTVYDIMNKMVPTATAILYNNMYFKLLLIFIRTEELFTVCK